MGIVNAMGTNMLFYICKEILKIIMVENRVIFMVAKTIIENKPHYFFDCYICFYQRFGTKAFSRT